MTDKEFQIVLNKRIDLIKHVLGAKAKEYASDEDRLHNFHVASRMDGITTQQAIWGMLMKHLVSVKDLVDGSLEPTADIVDEKFGDLINYLILLEASFHEDSISPPSV